MHSHAGAWEREKIFDALVEYLDDLYQQRPLAISFELTELTFGLSFRKNNIHAKLREKAAPL